MTHFTQPLLGIDTVTREVVYKEEKNGSEVMGRGTNSLETRVVPYRLSPLRNGSSGVTRGSHKSSLDKPFPISTGDKKNQIARTKTKGANFAQRAHRLLYKGFRVKRAGNVERVEEGLSLLRRMYVCM